MLITIVRHGETTANEDDLLQGQLPGELSKRGLLQGQALARELKNHKFDVMLTTDLKRGLDTAKIIAQFHDVAFVSDSLLRERSFGIYEGKNRSRFYNHERSLSDPYSHRPDKGESFCDLYYRANLFVDKIKRDYSSKSILVVSHGDLVRMFLGVLQGFPVERASKLKQANACINVVVF